MKYKSVVFAIIALMLLSAIGSYQLGASQPWEATGHWQAMVWCGGGGAILLLAFYFFVLKR